MKTVPQLKNQLQAASDLLASLSNAENRHVMIMSNLTNSSIDEIVGELSVDSYSQIDVGDIHVKTRLAIIDILNISVHIRKIKITDWKIISSCLEYTADRLASRLDGDLIFLPNCGEKHHESLSPSRPGHLPSESILDNLTTIAN